MYLGVDRTWPGTTHHTITFARDYRKNIEQISGPHKSIPEDFSFYVRDTSATDPSTAPPGHSALCVLVPVPNNSSGLDWEKEKGPFRERVLQALEQRTHMKDLRSHIRAETIICPADWEKERDVFHGAVFNLAHNLGQMLYFRPRNRFEELRHCFLVGGGTHPGSGLPTIYESGRISANLICQDLGVPFEPPPPLPEG
jgi:phytoene desaturase